MPDPPVLPPRLDAALERVLEPGETVVWAGAPERWPNPAAVLLRALVVAALLATGAAWFVGFVDDSTLPLAFVVVVEHGGSGSDVAGSVAAQLLEQAQS